MSAPSPSETLAAPAGTVLPDRRRSQIVTAVTLLLVEDSEMDATLVAQMLARARGLRADVRRAERLDEAMAELAAGGIDLVLLDLTLPDSRGIETFERVQEAAPETPVVVLSAHGDEDLAVTAVRNGAQDYLVKGQVTAESLARSIQYGLERHRVLSSVRGLSLVDDLTGLYNRRGFVSVATSHVQLARRAPRRFVLVYADLDGLKEINDTFGHREGDTALVKTAEILRHTFRASDVVGRVGGDEFVVLAVEVGGQGERPLVQRLGEAFEEFDILSPLPYRLSLTAGAVVYDPEGPLSLDAMLADADRALYERKRGRRSTGVIRR
jgi:two-component system cell cycle response regulator